MIKTIEWTEEYSVGVELLDQQHQHLLGLVNNLIERSETKYSDIVVSETLQKMQKYARFHFDTEEKYLAAHDYLELEDHKEKHREFEKKTATYLRAMTLPVDDLPTTLLVYLRYWWVDHILVDDMRYKYLLRRPL